MPPSPILLHTARLGNRVTRSLVVWIPSWSVVAAERDDKEPEAQPGLPLAVVHKGLIRECSDTARLDGVRAGMKRREAQQLCPQLVVLAYRPERDAAFFDRIIIQLSDYVPDHALLNPGMVLFRARGLRRFYGSEERAGQVLQNFLVRDVGLRDTRVGVADSVFAAVMAATHSSKSAPLRIIEPGQSPAFLATLQLDVLDDQNTVSLLTRLGLRTLGDFVGLGADVIRERFGATGEHLYRLAQGNDAATLALNSAPLDVSETIELPEPHLVVEQLAFAIKHKTEQYLERLRDADRVCTRVHIILIFDNHHESSREWLHPRFFTAPELIDRVRWQLEHTAKDNLPSDGVSPGVIRVRYEALSPEDRATHEPGLWGSGPDSRVHHVLSRVQSMLGASGVLTAHSQPSRHSFETHVLTPWGDKALRQENHGPLPGVLPKPLPATVFQSPHKIDLLDAQGHPVIVLGQRLSHPPTLMTLGFNRLQVSSWAGPWPVVEKWWDATTTRHDYRLQLLDERGVGWLATTSSNNTWYLEARYD
jgi:protein ImuB